MARVIIVGAGVSGLATAVRLADFGHHVTVAERAGAVGGRVRPQSLGDFTFHADPAPLTIPAVYRDLFRKTGRPLERVIDLVPLDPAIRYRFADHTEVDLPHASRAGAAAAFDTAFGPGSGDAWRRVVDHGRALWDVLRSPYLEAPPGTRDLLQLARPATLRTLTPWRSLREAAHALASDDRMSLILEHATGDPRRAPALLAVAPYLHETFGRWHVASGPGALATALAERAVERGATISTGTDVSAVSVDGGRVTGVRLRDDRRLSADIVVGSAVHDLETSGRNTRPAVTLPEPGAVPFTVHLALRGEAPGLPAHTVSFPATTGPALDDVYGQTPRPPRDPVIDIYAPLDPALHPDDGRAWTIVVRTPDRIDWTVPGRSTDYADHLLSVLAGRGLDATGHVIHRAVISPSDFRDDIGSPGTSGWPPGRGVRPLLQRPRNVTSVRGLFRVGSTAYPGPGLALVGLSSLMVADLIGRA